MMAKSGGMLNAICAKLLKTTNDNNDDNITADTCDKDEEAVDADVENNNAPGYKDTVIMTQRNGNGRMMIPSPTQDSQQSIDSLISIETESSTRAKPLSPQEKWSSLAHNEHSCKSTRRNRRKNIAPRSIAQLHEADDYIEEEIEEFEINNRDATLFHTQSEEPKKQATMMNTVIIDGNDENETMVLDLSNSVSSSVRGSESLTTSSSSVQIETLAAEEYMVDVTGALDLSLSKNSKSSDNTSISMNSESSQLVAVVTDDSSRDSTPPPTYPQITANLLGISSEPQSRDKVSSCSDAKDMKSYAQNTMNELLSLYGLGKQEAESITESVSLENFSSGNILARQMPGSQLNQQIQAVTSAALAAVTNREQKKSGGKTKASAETNTADTSSDAAPLVTDEAAYSKFVENISKLSKLPQGLVSSEQMKELLLAAAVMKHKSSSLKSLPFPLASNLKLTPPADGGSGYDRSCSLNRLPAEGAASTGILGTMHESGSSPTTFTPHLFPVAGKVGAVNKFASSADYVKACFAGSSLGNRVGQANTSGTNNLLPDYSKYVKRFGTYEDCKDTLCKEMAYKEHFHCMDCNFKVFTKKEEMIRHFKWHKKREESLQHGFLRFSPIDDCSSKFGSCTHNGKQTHYHCLQAGCNKVYISTSDVQMHSNYHRKDSAIIQEGFQRFRATEDCGETSCSFYGQRTTHFHCRRASCKFTFKNKADMEKHKAYHQKDEALAKDGFKKFMKYEPCNYAGCRYSKAANHIHCIRPGCDYVLHSTGQLYSHKRKHERRDFEHAYRRFQEEQKNKTKLSKTTVTALSTEMLAKLPQGISSNALNLSSTTTIQQDNSEYIDMEDLQTLNQTELTKIERKFFPKIEVDADASTLVKREATPEVIDSEDESHDEQTFNQALPSTLAKLASKLSGCSTSSLDDSLNLPIPEYIADQEDLHDISLSGIKEELVGNHGGIPTNVPGFVPTVSPPINNKKEKDETWKKYLTRYTANDPCHPRCHFLYKDHYHCNNGGCGMIFRSKDGVREHGRYHEQQDRITSLSYRTMKQDEHCEDCPHRKIHYHCLWASCKTVVLDTDPAFTRLEHHKIHEYARAAANRQNRPFNMYKMQTDAFRRRRGRPPKYPKNEIPVVPKINMSDEDITGALSKMSNASSCSTLLNGFIEFSEGQPCPDEKCFYFLKKHFHCVRPRCHHATDRADVLNLHAKDFHNYVTILEGFEFFDRNVNCRRTHCHNNKANKHFHCMRPGCDYSFVRHSTMAQHDKKHRMAELNVNTHQDTDPSLLTPTGSPIKAGVHTTLLQQMTQMQPLNLAPHGIKGTTMVSPLQSPVTVTPPPAHNTKPQAPQQSPFAGDKESSVVKTKGTYFPMSGLSSVESAAVSAAMAVKAQMETGVVRGAGGAALLASPAPNVTVTATGNLINIAPKPISTQVTATGVNPEGLPLQMLLQQRGPQPAPQVNWLTMKMKMHYGVLQNCGRPFCKLKKKDHYHCFDCNQAFSDPVRLRSHVTKHGLKVDKSEKVQQPMLNPALLGNPAIILPPNQVAANEAEQLRKKIANGSGIINITPEDVNNYTAVNDENEDDEFDEEEDVNVSSSLNLNPNTFSNMLSRSAKLSMNDGFLGVKNTVLESAMDLSSPNGHDEEAASEEENAEDDGEGEESFDADDSSLMVYEDVQGTHDVFNDKLNVDKNIVLSKAQGMRGETDTVAKKSRKGGSGRRSSRKRSAPKNDDFIDSDAAYTKQRKIDLKIKSKPKTPPKSRSSPRARVIEQSQESKRLARMRLQENVDVAEESAVENNVVAKVTGDNNKTVQESSLEGFRRYPFGEECGAPRCAYRLSGSHWHCEEPNCSFGLNDRSRAAAHTQKHAQVKAMLGKDFEHYSAKSNCNRPDCEHAMSAAHFHCKKCAYITTITNKVQVHRRQHEREEYISRSGFVQYTGLTNCQMDWCTYSTKQTHYHCTVENCKHSTVGLAQMQAHKNKKHQQSEK